MDDTFPSGPPASVTNVKLPNKKKNHIGRTGVTSDRKARQKSRNESGCVRACGDAHSQRDLRRRAADGRLK